MSEFGDTIPYTVGNNTIDLSAQLEKQLNDQMSDDPLDMQEEENKIRLTTLKSRSSILWILRL